MHQNKNSKARFNLYRHTEIQAKFVQRVREEEPFRLQFPIQKNPRESETVPPPRPSPSLVSKMRLFE